MNRTVVKHIVLLVLGVCAFAAALLLVPRDRGVWEARDAKDGGLEMKRSANSGVDHDPSTDGAPRFQWADADELDGLKASWMMIAEALSTCSQKEMEERVSAVSERTARLPWDQFDKVVEPVDSLLRKCFQGSVMPFADKDAFEVYMAAHLKAMALRGEVELANPPVPSMLARQEGIALAKLREYEKRFVDNGSQDLAKCAAELAERLVDQIESGRGLTRRYMHANLKLQMKLVEVGMSTRERVLRGVRTDAYTLIEVAGYVPKWLDEEFPLPPSADKGNQQRQSPDDLSEAVK